MVACYTFAQKLNIVSTRSYVQLRSEGLTQDAITK
jgi:hypothetical protein